MLAARLIPLLVFATAGCDPVYEYCVDVVHCSDGTPVPGVRVRWDHEGLLDRDTDEQGRACGANVGSPAGHPVLHVLKKNGYVSLSATAISRDLDFGGRALDVDICVCRVSERRCSGRLVDPGHKDSGVQDHGALQ